LSTTIDFCFLTNDTLGKICHMMFWQQNTIGILSVYKALFPNLKISRKNIKYKFRHVHKFPNLSFQHIVTYNVINSFLCIFDIYILRIAKGRDEDLWKWLYSVICGSHTYVTGKHIKCVLYLTSTKFRNDVVFIFLAWWRGKV